MTPVPDQPSIEKIKHEILFSLISAVFSNKISIEEATKRIEKMIAKAKALGAEEAREEIYMILSEELSDTYPDPQKGFRDVIEMDTEELIEKLKDLSQPESKV